MERNYDEVISDMLIQLAQIERNLEQEHSRMEAFDKRMDLTIKRMVKAETRLETSEKRMSDFDKKLEQSLKDQKAQSQLQAKANAHFLKQLTQQGRLMESLIKKNGLKL